MEALITLVWYIPLSDNISIIFFILVPDDASLRNFISSAVNGSSKTACRSASCDRNRFLNFGLIFRLSISFRFKVFNINSFLFDTCSFA